MSITDDEQTRTPDLPVEPEPAEQPATLLSRLRARRAEMADESSSGERTVEYAIPGYAEELWAQFRYTPDLWDRLKKIGVRAVKSKHPRKELYAQADTLITACSNILVSEDGGSTFEPLDPSGESVGFDVRLIDLLGIPNPHPDKALTAREIVFAVFSNDLAVSALANNVSMWAQGEDSEVDEDFSEG